MATLPLDTCVESADELLSSTDSESELMDYALPPDDRNGIQPYRFEPRYEPNFSSTPAAESESDIQGSDTEKASRLDNMDW